MISFIIYGLSQSLTILALALGFHLIFGLGGVAYFCYGAFLTIGAYIIALLYKIGVGIIPSYLIGIVITSIIGFVLYRIIISRVQGVLLNEALICLAIMLLVRDVLALSYGTAPFSFPRLWPEGIISISDSIFEISRLGSMVVVPPFLLVTWLFLKYTSFGRAMRAVSQDRDASLLMGVIPKKLIAYMVIVSTLICMIAGVLLLSYLNLTPEIGETVLLEALFVVIVGGLGSLKGLILASFIIGFSETFTAIVIGSQMKLLLPLVIVFFILIFLPSGIFGVSTKLEERM